ncbi:MFS transporter [Paenibacillus hexagrammi]|uniref:MFS transporter n=1 Tax=Paenibacillus hexagrammi TaxID=2908839 RepID=A0ABY3SP22_9BACL|nr:MFS transporter [Paenibacillus sp. YPD9-1]UJF34885.1 MFS transporter [Paenibacillus sp. YPD9-1]
MEIRRRWLMASIGLGMLLNPLNSSMISVAIARLQEVYRLDFAVTSWMIFAFYISSSIAQPVMGKAGDLFGRRRIFLSGLIVVSVSSLLAPLSPGFGWLIAFRVIQSIGTSMIGAVGMAIMRNYVTENQAKGLAVLSIFISGAAAIGPSVGGFFIHWWDWPAIFLVNIPVAILSFFFAWRAIPADERKGVAVYKKSPKMWLADLDGLGILLFSLGVVGLLLGLLSIHSWRYDLIGLLGLLIMGLFIKHELKAGSPFIPVRTFAQYPAISWINLEFMLVNVLYYSLFFGFPSYLQMERQLSAMNTGLLMLSLGLCTLLTSPLAGRWIDKSGPRPALILSAALMVLGAVWIVTLNNNSSLIRIGLILAVFGISNGLNNVGMQAALFRSAPKEHAGVASGLFLTSRYMGTIFASLLLDFIFGHTIHSSGLRVLGVILAVIASSLVIMIWQKNTEKFRESSSI